MIGVIDQAWDSLHPASSYHALVCGRLLAGKGRFVITLEPTDKMSGQRPYQGIVLLDGDDMATVIDHMLRPRS
jgi:redox-regulated HSP33 family molecular chaperone